MFEEHSPYSWRDVVDWAEPEAGFLLTALVQGQIQDAFGVPTNHCADTLRSYRGALMRHIAGIDARYQRRASELFDSVPAGLEAVHYHLANIDRIESEILEMFAQRIDRFHHHLGFQTSMMCPAQLTFEYQAFLSAIRRLLDYLANAVTAFFGEHGHNFRTLRDTIQNRRPLSASDALCALLDNEALLTTKIIGPSGGPLSPRNAVAHTQFLHAGNISIAAVNGIHEVRIIGGVEELFPWSVAPSRIVHRGSAAVALSTISPVLAQRTLAIEQLIMRAYVRLTLAV